MPSVSNSGQLPEFNHIQRFHDDQFNMTVARILPGELYVTRLDEMITTVLGSCIAACISDVEAGIGGMNHFMLPDGADGSSSFASQAARYGLFAMEQLINTIMKYGGKRERLQVKIFGGGRMIANMSDVVRRTSSLSVGIFGTRGCRSSPKMWAKSSHAK
jgi:chemotaxis protein CheD